MTDTTSHRATPDHWAQCEDDAARWEGDTAVHCLLELRARIEALEADSRHTSQSTHFCFEAIIKRIEKLEEGATCPHVVTGDEGTSYCGLAEHVAAASSPDHVRDATKMVPAGSLAALTADVLAEYDMTLPAGPTAAARAAIRVVAEWLRRGDAGAGSAWTVAADVLDAVLDREVKQ